MTLFVVGLLCSLPLRATAGPGTEAAEPTQEPSSFPDVAEVLQGRAFPSKTARDVFFLKRIRADYPEHWGSLVSANVNLHDYVENPDKMLRFINELGDATEGTDDRIARTNLAAVVIAPMFYDHSGAWRPEIQSGAAAALIKIGPLARKELAKAFTPERYRRDTAGLEQLAAAIGTSKTADTNLSAALAKTAFQLTATNGGSYPRCTRETVRQLLKLPDGSARIAQHLNAEEVFKDPGRFQAVIEAIAASPTDSLRAPLAALQTAVTQRLHELAAYPGPYREDLAELGTLLENALKPR